jgi:hypothetical protein
MLLRRNIFFSNFIQRKQRKFPLVAVQLNEVITDGGKKVSGLPGFFLPHHSHAGFLNQIFGLHLIVRQGHGIAKPTLEKPIQFGWWVSLVIIHFWLRKVQA